MPFKDFCIHVDVLFTYLTNLIHQQNMLTQENIQIWLLVLQME